MAPKRNGRRRAFERPFYPRVGPPGQGSGAGPILSRCPSPPPPKRRWPTRPPRRPDHIGTIGDLIRRRQHIEIYCVRQGYHHHAPVDLNGLRSEYGEGYAVAGFVARSRCSKCGARYPDIAITVTPAGNPEVIGYHRPGDPAEPDPK